MKNEEGITLIALIITIIVMLILVGVAITVAIQGGLFGTVQSAKEQTQVKTDEERLYTAALGTLDNNGRINLSNLQLPTGFTYDDETGAYQGPTGNQYEINGITGQVTEYKGPIDRNLTYNLTFTDLSTLTQEDWETIANNDMMTVFYPSTYSSGTQAFSNSDISSLWYETEDDGILVYNLDGTLQSHENYNFMLKQGYWRYAGESDSIDDIALPEYTYPITLSNLKIASAEEMEDFGFTSFTDELLRKIFIIEEVEN